MDNDRLGTLFVTRFVLVFVDKYDMDIVDVDKTRTIAI